MQRDASSPTRPLLSGPAIPVLGLGVYQSAPGQETYDAVTHALRAGYRHVDTARYYRNERDVGRALRDSGVPRDQVFVTTKLANDDHGYDAAIRACERSLSELGLDYLDLYLIHWPVAGKRRDSWRALVELRATKRCRAIGVSNYTVRHLEELLGSSDVVPDVDQIELSPFLPQTELRSFAAQHGIVVEAYSPLTQGRRLRHPTVVAVAEKYGRTPAQVLLRWGVEHGLVVIPKSVKEARIRENAALFDFTLAPADLTVLDTLDEGLHTCWDPTNVA